MAEELLLDCWDVENRPRLASVFGEWAGGPADLRVLFTPDVLIAVGTESARGYIYDDGYTFECWIEVGITGFRQLLAAEFVEGIDRLAPIVGSSDPEKCRGLLSLALEMGSPFEKVRHLI